MSKADHAALIYTPRYQDFDYGPSHPLKIFRLQLTYDLIETFSLLENALVIEAQPASEEDLLLIHKKEYLEALKAADEGQIPKEAFSYGLGTGDNPIFRGVYTFSRLAAGASLQAARLIEEGEVQRVFNPAGGLHHAFPAKASGFCYLNDPALAIAFLVKKGKRVAYVDIDAHHGDGVQAAFYETNRVLTISIHETGQFLFPGTGFVEEIGRGGGLGYSVNVPLWPGSDDEIFLWVFEEVVPPLLKSFQPDVVVAQLGIDSHRTDPLTHLNYTLHGFSTAVRRLTALAPKLLALGGGGYDLANVPRAWTLSWAILTNRADDLPEALPEGFQRKMQALRLRPVAKLLDEPFALQGREKARAFAYAQEQVERVKHLVFPHHGL